MEIPGYQPFYIDSADALRAEIARLGLDVPTTDDFGPLAQPIRVGPREMPNRFCAQPIAGGDAPPGGAPGELTRRRYRRYRRPSLKVMERQLKLEGFRTA